MSRRRSLLRRLGTGAAVAAAIMLSPAELAFADAAGPTDYETTIRAVTPDVSSAVEFSIAGSDAFVRAIVTPGHELIVLGYDGEDYIWVDAAGAVFENHNSETYYYNRERYGGDIPPEANSTADPDWVQVDDDGEHAWHDHRAHWMAEHPLVGMRPGDSFPADDIEVIVDGRPVTITVVTTLGHRASVWWLVGGVAVAVPVVALVATARRRHQERPFLIGVVTAAFATAFGVAEFGAVPGSTGPSTTWWAVPVLAGATFAAGFWLCRSARGASMALLIGGGAELVIWALLRGGGLLAAYRPTLLPIDADRVTTVAVAIIGTALAVFGVMNISSRSG